MSRRVAWKDGLLASSYYDTTVQSAGARRTPTPTRWPRWAQDTSVFLCTCRLLLSSFQMSRAIRQISRSSTQNFESPIRVAEAKTHSFCGMDACDLIIPSYRLCTDPGLVAAGSRPDIHYWCRSLEGFLFPLSPFFDSWRFVWKKKKRKNEEEKGKRRLVRVSGWGRKKKTVFSCYLWKTRRTQSAAERCT